MLVDILVSPKQEPATSGRSTDVANELNRCRICTPLLQEGAILKSYAPKGGLVMKKPKKRSKRDISVRKKRKRTFYIGFFKVGITLLMLLLDVYKLIKKIIDMFK